MKHLIFLSLLLPVMAIAQKVEIGMLAGVSSRGKAVGEFSIPLQFKNGIKITPYCFRFFSDASMKCSPKIFETRLGYRVKKAEAYTGLAYHLDGVTEKEPLKKNAGFKPALGLGYHVAPKLIILASMSGGIYTLQFGIN